MVKVTRRDFILGGLATAVLGGLEVARRGEIKKMEAHREEHGGLENPKYLITAKIDNFPTVEQELLSQNPEYERLAEIEDRVAVMASKMGAYEKRLSEPDFDPTNGKTASEMIAMIKSGESFMSDHDKVLSSMESDKRSLDLIERFNISYAHMGNSQELEERSNSMSSRRMESMSLKEKEDEYGDMIEYAKRTFSQLTGENLPAGLSLKQQEMEPGTLGYHKFIEKDVRFGDNGYEKTLGTNLHELGHVSYQGQEEGFFNLLHFKNSNTEETSTMEEAAAYLFNVAGIQQIRKSDSELAENMSKIISNERTYFLKEFAEGSDECHRTGWALAEALADNFSGNYADAFNYLSTRGQFSDISEDIITKYESFRDGMEYDSSGLLERRETITSKARDLGEKLNSLLDKYALKEESIDVKAKTPDLLVLD